MNIVEKKRFYEQDIKDLILRKEKMFGILGKSAIVFEKKLSNTKDKTVKTTIADCLIFSEQKGIIGIEIKTERDSTQRLNRQLRAYSLTCDYVYVMCHDDHVAKVEQVIKRYQHHHVGIIAYSEFRGQPVAGIYRLAQPSYEKSVYHALNMLWKSEIVKIMGTFRHPAPRIEAELGLKAYDIKDRSGGIHGLGVQSGFSNKMTKPQLIKNFIVRVGPDEANRVLCDIMINNRNHPEKSIKLYHFSPAKIKDRGDSLGEEYI